MAGRPSSKKTLGIWMNGEFVGHWTFSSTYGHSFSYDAAWIRHPRSRSLSLSLPLSLGTNPFTGSRVVPARIIWTRFCNSSDLSHGISLTDFVG